MKEQILAIKRVIAKRYNRGATIQQILVWLNELRQKFHGIRSVLDRYYRELQNAQEDYIRYMIIDEQNTVFIINHKDEVITIL